MDAMNSVIQFLGENVETASLVLAFLLSKLVSTEKKVPIVTAIQKGFDMAGKALLLMADILAAVIKSDGVLGKK